MTLKEALRQVPLFAQLPDTRLQWLTEQGTEVFLEPGDLHRAEGSPTDCVFVMLEGEVRVFQKVGDQELVLATYGSKTLYGEIPVLMGDEYFWAAGRAVTSCHIFELRKAAFWELIASCACITTAIFRTMAERVQDLQSMLQQREKLAALGTLAAGLAHELNNPAAAVNRGARNLEEIFQELPSLSLKLNQQQLTSAQLQFLGDLQRDATKRAKTASRLDPLAQSDQEDEVTDWLEDRDITDAWKLAPTLVSAGLDTQWLNSVTEGVPAYLLSDVLAWLTATLTGNGLLNEVEQGVGRISNLVKAIKDYSYMDQAPVQEVDVHEGLENTLIILGNKLKQGVLVTRDYNHNLPRINAYGSELNQVWTNLIDNAIAAMNGQGKIWICTTLEHDHVLVQIADNGPGIPPDIQHRIFEPFFTTKGVGEGTGLGLDMTYRIVGKHNGNLSFTSSPGNTKFQVRLPIAAPDELKDKLLGEVIQR